MTRIEFENNRVTKKCPANKWALRFLKEINDRKNSYVLETLTASIFANEMQYTYEYQQGHSLEYHLHIGETLPLTTIFYQLATAVNFIHSYNFVHRDIKPPNIIWDGEKITLIDLDTITTILHGPVKRLGTPIYWPPELMYAKESTEYKAADMWAVGITIFIMANGYHPFDGEDFEHLALNVIYKPVSKDVQYQPVLGMILAKNPNARLDSLTFKTMWNRHFRGPALP